MHIHTSMCGLLSASASVLFWTSRVKCVVARTLSSYSLFHCFVNIRNKKIYSAFKYPTALSLSIMSDASTHSLTGYGLNRLIFDGNEEKYELWELKFLAHLRLQKLADVLKDDDSSDSDEEEYTEKNASVFAELV